MKMLCNISLAAAMLLAATAAHAQDGTVSSGGGCSQSPENPTIILSLLGTSGFAFAATRDRLRIRLGKRNRG